VATTVYIHDNKVVKFQNKICIVPTAQPFSVEVTTTTTPQDFKLYLAGASSLKITWGDTNEDTYSTDGNKTHSYATPGTYTVTFVSGTADRISFGGDTGSGCTPELVKSVVTPVPISLGLTSAKYMFCGCTGLGNTGWCAKFFDDASANITDMQAMFLGCTAFNQSVASFNTANVTDMSYMFNGCSAFNQSVANFNTANVTNMQVMFSGCAAFNQSVANFDTAKVTSMDSMFYACDVFDQSVANFNVANVTSAEYMLNSSGFSKTNYDLLLVAWAAQAVQNSVTFDAGAAHYSAGDPTTAHDHLTGTHSWSISDGGTP